MITDSAIDTRTNRRSNLRKLYAAEALSGAGDGIMWVALISSLADEPRAGLWLGLAVLARLGPRALLSLPAGWLIDRAALRRLLVATDLARAAAMLTVWLMALADLGPAPIVAGVLVSYVIGVPTRPGLSAALPRVSGETHLAEANAILSTLRQVMTFIGPLIGVGVVALSTVGGYAVNAVSFALSALLIAGVRGVAWPERHPADHETDHPRPAILKSFTGGLDAVGAVRGLPALIGLVSAMYFVRGAEMVLWVLVVRDVLETDPSSFGYLAGAVGLGAVLATPLARRSADSTVSTRALVVGIVTTAAPTALLAFSGRLATAVLLLVLVGAGMVVFEVVSVVTIQRTAPADALGRVFGAVHSASSTGKLLGAIVAPVLVALFETEGALIAVATLLAASAVVAIPSIRRLARAAGDRRQRLGPTVDVLESLDLFEGAPRASLERVAGVVVEETYEPGVVLIREGDDADDLLVARSGEFDVLVAGQKINEMGPDAWFGEIGLVDHVPRTATVLTRTPATVWRIPGEVFIAALEESGAPPTALVDGIADRLATGRAV